jgi:hypothetical protein
MAMGKVKRDGGTARWATRQCLHLIAHDFGIADDRQMQIESTLTRTLTRQIREAIAKLQQLVEVQEKTIDALEAALAEKPEERLERSAASKVM